MLSLPKKNTTLEIIFDNDTCIMYGLPEESEGCKLKGKVLLTSNKGLKIKSFNFAFIGKTNVTCCPFITSTRPDCNETQTVCRRECSFPSPPRIPPGIHEFKFEVDLPGHLPASFKGTRGKIEYWCYVIIERPMFHADISIKKPVIIRRSLIPNDILASPITLQDRLTTFTEGILEEKVQYHINAPIMAYREGGLVSLQLSLKPLSSNIIVKSVEYGLKEIIRNSFLEPRTRLSIYPSPNSPLSSPLSVSAPTNIDSPYSYNDYLRRSSFSDINYQLSQIIYNSETSSQSSSHYSDVNIHQSTSTISDFQRSSHHPDVNFRQSSNTMSDFQRSSRHSDVNFRQSSNTMSDFQRSSRHSDFQRSSRHSDFQRSSHNSDFQRSSRHSDVNFRQSRIMSGSIDFPNLNNLINHHHESLNNDFNNILKKTISHREQLSLEIPLIITTKSSYNYHSNRTSMRNSFRNSMINNMGIDNERSPPYSMVDEPPAYMYAALVPPPPRYNPE
ncbi:16418_t:CDS:2 [Dentiscutata heterogama]|uniref:16418_t:CDS:1 n=1 Tax=Dentiscutata heterogama TaxID=1316150 RepID=A0ACA9KH46_9GLOM|nr:16418_t:CDS:2 [Dentiscutata heterogama]